MSSESDSSVERRKKRKKTKKSSRRSSTSKSSLQRRSRSRSPRRKHRKSSPSGGSSCSSKSSSSYSSVSKVTEWLHGENRQDRYIKSPESFKESSWRDGLVSVNVNGGKANFPLTYRKGKKIDDAY